MLSADKKSEFCKHDEISRPWILKEELLTNIFKWKVFTSDASARKKNTWNWITTPLVLGRHFNVYNHRNCPWIFSLRFERVGGNRDEILISDVARSSYSDWNWANSTKEAGSQRWKRQSSAHLKGTSHGERQRTTPFYIINICLT